MSQQDGARSASRRAFLRAAAGSATLAGASGAAAAQEGGGQAVTVDVVNYAFNPGTEEPLRIPPGTTVTWVWQSDGHNVHVDSQPDGANWSGHEPIENAGFEYEHTFETEGEYHYWCTPHKSLGMVADLVVDPEATLEPAGGGGASSILPDSAKTIGVATVGAMTSVLALAYFFLKYGGSYGEPEE